MIDSIVDRLYRPIRISNRMRLAKLLLLLLRLEGCCYDLASISRRLHRHHSGQQVKDGERSDTNLIHSTPSKFARSLSVFRFSS